MLDFLKKLVKREQLYLPKKGDTIVILKHFFYEDITDNVYDKYPEKYSDPAFHMYPNRIVLEYFQGQEYIVEYTLGIDKIDIKSLEKLDETKIHKYYNVDLEANDYQVNRKNVGHCLNYLRLYRDGYIIEKSEYRNRKLKEIGI